MALPFMSCDGLRLPLRTPHLGTLALLGIGLILAARLMPGSPAQTSPQSPIDRLLVDAVKRQDPVEVERLLRTGASANAVDYALAPYVVLPGLRGFPQDYELSKPPTALALAVAALSLPDYGCLPGPDYSRYIQRPLGELEAKAKSDMLLPPYIANVRICQDLIDAGARVDNARLSGITVRNRWMHESEQAPGPDGSRADAVTPLAMAICKENSHVVHMLLAHGARLGRGETAAIADAAILFCRRDDVIPLMRQGATFSTDSFSPLTFALWLGRWRLAQLLLKEYGQPDFRSPAIGTPLHYADWQLRCGRLSPDERAVMTEIRTDLLAVGAHDLPGDLPGDTISSNPANGGRPPSLIDRERAELVFTRRPYTID